MQQQIRHIVLMLTLCLLVCMEFVFTGCSNNAIGHGAVTSGVGARTVTSGLPSSYSWILQTGLRGGYMGMSDPIAVVSQMKQAGMNALLVKTDYPVPITTDTQQYLASWGSAAFNANMHCFIVFNWRGSLETLLGTRRYVNDAGVTLSKTPCPLDETYWTTYVQNRMTYLAQNGKALHLDGAILDPEMYAADQVEYTGCCYCDACFSEFLTSIGKSTTTLPSPDQRVQWLANNNLTASYQQRFVNRIKGFCAATETAVHQANPDFLLGECHLDRPVPFHHGVAMGLGNATYPVLCFSETTYDTGYTSYVDTMQQTFTTYPASVLFLAGLNILNLPTANLATNIYNCATHSQGYWIYTMECLDGQQLKYSYYQLPEANDLYWSAFTSGDSMLDTYYSQGSGTSSGGSSTPPTYPSIDLSGISPLSLTALPVSSSLSIGPVTPPRLRYRNPLYILGTQGQDITVQIRNKPLAAYTDASVYAVLDPSDKQIAGGTIALNQTGNVTWTPAVSGVYTLVVDSNLNAHYLQMVTPQRASYRAISSMPLSIQEEFGNLYFYVPNKVTSFTLYLRSSGNAPGMGGTVKVYGPNGALVALKSGDYTATTPLKVPVSGTKAGKIWAVTATGVSNDLYVYPSTNISPFFSVSPQGLVKQQ